MGLNRGQATQLNVSAAVALRGTFLVEALLRLAYTDDAATCRDLYAVVEKLTAYRSLVNDLASRFALTGDPHDVRPIAIDEALRLRDALNPVLADDLLNFGALAPEDEVALRQGLATLSMLVDEIVRAIYRLPYRSC